MKDVRSKFYKYVKTYEFSHSVKARLSKVLKSFQYTWNTLAVEARLALECLEPDKNRCYGDKTHELLLPLVVQAANLEDVANFLPKKNRNSSLFLAVDKTLELRRDF